MKKAMVFSLAILLVVSLAYGAVMAKNGPKVDKNPLVQDERCEDGKGCVIEMKARGGVFHTWWEFYEGTSYYEEFGAKLHTVCLEAEKAPKSWDPDDDYIISWNGYICKQQVNNSK